VLGFVILPLGGVAEYAAMLALAGLLIVVGIQTVKPDAIESVLKTGRVRVVLMTVTLVLTLLMPLQNAVLVGVGISTILFIIRQVDRVVTWSFVIHDGGRIRDEDPSAGVLQQDPGILAL
jgi:SulP family sulfate permease